MDLSMLVRCERMQSTTMRSRDILQRLFNRPAPRFSCSQPVRGRSFGDDVANRHAGRQGTERVLEDDLNVTTERL